MTKKVLIIDDSATARASIKGLLDRLNYNVKTANNGLDSFEIILQFQPDFILLDISMPILDGLEVLSILKNNLKTKNIPIIILSGKERMSDKIRAEQQGAAGFLNKPCDETKLKELISSLNLQ